MSGKCKVWLSELLIGLAALRLNPQRTAHSRSFQPLDCCLWGKLCGKQQLQHFTVKGNTKPRNVKSREREDEAGWAVD
jgi:hypothetical protein